MNPQYADLLTRYQAQVADLMDQLEGRVISTAVWYERMAELLATYHTASMLVGLAKSSPNDSRMKFPATGYALLAGTLAFQVNRLRNFRTVIDAAGEFNPAWPSRAAMYTRSTRASYWDGLIYGRFGRFLPLPAMPGDGTTQCLTGCKCEWDIKELDAEGGDYDCYWKTNPAEHCQSCIERERQWNPMRIRNGMLVDDDLTAVKHLSGQHNQQSHARGGGRRTATNPGGFRVEPMHHTDHRLATRKWEVPENGVVTLYHGTTIDDPQKIVKNGLLSGDIFGVYAHQAPPLPGHARRYTVEFEANLDKNEMYSAGTGSRYPRVAYTYPEDNTYTTDFTYYGVWKSGGRDIPASRITKIYDNDNDEIVFSR